MYLIPRAAAAAPFFIAINALVAAGATGATAQTSARQDPPTTSASRPDEALSRAPAAVAVITSDDIHHAGVVTLPDALRLAGELFVARDGQTWAIGARGLQSTMADGVAVFIDGRRVNTPLFGGVFWDVQDVLLEDVDRIEVLRGAAGTLWGAGATNGTIQVITKPAAATRKGLIQVGAGSQTNVIAGRYGMAADGGDLRVYGKVRYLNALPYITGGATPHEPLQIGQGGFRFDRSSSPNSLFTLQGEAGRGHVDIADSPNIFVNMANVLARFTRTSTSGARLQVQTSYEHFFRTLPDYTEWRNTTNGGLQYRFRTSSRHTVLVGSQLTVSDDRTDTGTTTAFDPSSRTTTTIDVFAQDQIALTKTIDAIVGTRAGRNWYTGVEHAPSAKLRWMPDARQVVWGGVSRAVRLPSRFDVDGQLSDGTSGVILARSRVIQSAVVVAREIGYRVTGRRASFDVTAFSNAHTQMRSDNTPSATAFGNGGNGHTSGIEIRGTYAATGAWQVSGGVTGLDEDLTFVAGARAVAIAPFATDDTTHQAWARSALALSRGATIDVRFRHVGALPSPHVPAYGELTVHGVLPLVHGWRVDVTGDNLLHDRHVEWIQDARSHAVTRSIYAGVIWAGR